MRILLLEDDLVLSEIIKEHLIQKGFDVVHFEDGEEALAFLYERKVDLMLLDVKVPSIDGFELLKILRAEKNFTPAIMITSANSSKDVKEGFDLGCDDYIKKPFEFEELDARVEHIIKLYNLEPSTLQIGEFHFDPTRYLLIKEDQTFQLSPKVSEILLYLFKHKNRVVSKEELVENIWSYDEIPSDATIRGYIKSLRKFLPYIQTYRGSGYALEL